MPRKKRRRRLHFRPTIFKLLGTKDRLTAAGGLGTLIELFDQSQLGREFKKCLPPRDLNRSQGSYRLALIQVASFIYGHDCLDDLSDFREDDFLEEAMKGQTAAPRTMGDYLRDFKKEHIEKLNAYLVWMSREIRKQIRQKVPEEYRPSESIRIDIDSTAHEQTSEQMEGLAWNYANKWCLDSQICFDEIGLCHQVELRKGSTPSGVRASEQLKACFSEMGFREKKYVSGDSAYCWRKPIQSCLAVGAKFTFTAHDGKTKWREKITQVSDWQEWKYSEEDLKKAEKRKRRLPEVHLGRVHWKPKWANGNLWLPMIIKRTKIEGETLPLGIRTADRYKYYAVVTNFDLSKKSYQEVVEYHNKRGNAERFIREEKYGFDLLHFPCQKLRANHAFLLLAMVAHNLLRWIAVIERPHKPHFSKKLRRRFIYIPSKVVSHARQVFLKMPERYLKEVQRLRQALTVQPTPLLDTS